MTDVLYSYTKTPVDLDSLAAQIRGSALITVALDYVSALGSALSVYMKATLPDDGSGVASLTCQTAALDAVVAAHIGIPVVPPPLPLDSLNRPLQTTSAFSINTDYKVKAKGYSGVATAGTTTNVDFAIGAQDRYINGVRILLKNHVWGDTIDFKVVDIDNVIGYGAGAVLNQFGFTWNVDFEKSDQGQVSFPYTARLPAGVYIRIAYNSTGIVNVDVKMNALMHQKVL